MWFPIFLTPNTSRITNPEEIDKSRLLKLKTLLMLGTYPARMFRERFSSKLPKGDRKNKNYNLKVSTKWFWHMIRNRSLVLFLTKGYCHFGNIFWFPERGIYIFLEESILLFLVWRVLNKVDVRDGVYDWKRIYQTIFCNVRSGM